MSNDFLARAYCLIGMSVCVQTGAAILRRRRRRRGLSRGFLRRVRAQLARRFSLRGGNDESTCLHLCYSCMTLGTMQSSVLTDIIPPRHHAFREDLSSPYSLLCPVAPALAPAPDDAAKATRPAAVPASETPRTQPSTPVPSPPATPRANVDTQVRPLTIFSRTISVQMP